MTEPTSPSVPNTTNRPLSPHLQIYRLPLTAALMSIAHRGTGVLLSVGLVAFVAWIWSAAYCPTAFEWLSANKDQWWMNLILIGWTGALTYHFFNGIRHLGWDAGSGFELDAAERSGWIVLVATALITAMIWYPHLCSVAIGETPAAEEEAAQVTETTSDALPWQGAAPKEGE